MDEVETANAEDSERYKLPVESADGSKMIYGTEYFWEGRSMASEPGQHALEFSYKSEVQRAPRFLEG